MVALQWGAHEGDRGRKKPPSVAPWGRPASVKEMRSSLSGRRALRIPVVRNAAVAPPRPRHRRTAARWAARSAAPRCTASSICRAMASASARVLAKLRTCSSARHLRAGAAVHVSAAGRRRCMVPGHEGPQQFSADVPGVTRGALGQQRSGEIGLRLTAGPGVPVRTRSGRPSRCAPGGRSATSPCARALSADDARAALQRHVVSVLHRLRRVALRLGLADHVGPHQGAPLAALVDVVT